MQLFTIGLLLLEFNGVERLDGAGEPIETYTNADVTGLARVFTGLSLNGPEFFYDFATLPADALYSPMGVFPEFHSDLEKSFLGRSIPANTGPTESVDQALDILFNHPNVGPFIARQLIQRFVTGDPTPDYVERVAIAFINGRYTLPNGTSVGAGARGDLSATLAAVLFDAEARTDAARAADDFGKPREPVLRFTAFARAFDVGTLTPENAFILWNTSSPGALAQHPYKSPSVFNFYRPGYVAPGTLSGAAGLTTPELQIVNASSTAGYADFMTYFAFRFAQDFETPPRSESFIADYAAELALADNPTALVDRLDRLLTYGEMSQTTRDSIIAMLEAIPLTNQFDPNYDGPAFRVETAVLMAVTSTDFIVQR